MTYNSPALLWSVSPSLTHLTKVKNDLLAENHETISGLMTDNLDPTPVGLPATMSTSTLTLIMPPNTSGQLNREMALLTNSTSLLSWKAWFHHFHTVAEF